MLRTAIGASVGFVVGVMIVGMRYISQPASPNTPFSMYRRWVNPTTYVWLVAPTVVGGLIAYLLGSIRKK